MLAGVIAAHWSDDFLLVYADWLEDRDDPRGAFLRGFVSAFGDPAAALPATPGFPAWLDLSGITLLRGLRECDLADRRQEVARLTRTTLLIECRGSADKKCPIGSTKFGGCPDLPTGTTWPRCGKGSLAFLAQFRLADLANTQAARRLPAEGMLSFFVLNYDGCAGPGLEFPPVTDTDTIRVIHTGERAELRRLKPPDALGEDNQVAPTRQLTFVEALDFRADPAIPGTDELEEFILRRGGRRRGGRSRTTNHFFGYPVYFRMDEPEEFRTGFVHLITFENSGELPFAWGDGADLYFYIRAPDLEAGRFDAVAVYSD
jgi:uncharacterized protein (TIGR02996 family)